MSSPYVSVLPFEILPEMSTNPMKATAPAFLQTFTARKTTTARVETDGENPSVHLSRGASLLVRSDKPSPPGITFASVLSQVVRTLTTDSSVLQYIPITVEPFSTRFNAPSAYVQLDLVALRMLLDEPITEPRVDLLEHWQTALQKHNPLWEVVWTPNEWGTDKRMSVRFTNLGVNLGKDHYLRIQPFIIAAIEQKGVNVLASYATPSGVSCVLDDRTFLDALIRDKMLDLPHETFPIPTISSVRHLEIATPFEMVITMPPSFNALEVGDQLNIWYDRVFSKDGVSQFAGGRVHPSEQHLYIFNLSTWKATSELLDASPETVSSFERFFAQQSAIIPYPTLLYDSNRKGLYLKPTKQVSQETVEKMAASASGFGEKILNRMSGIEARQDKQDSHIDDLNNVAAQHTMLLESHGMLLETVSNTVGRLVQATTTAEAKLSLLGCVQMLTIRKDRVSASLNNAMDKMLEASDAGKITMLQNHVATMNGQLATISAEIETARADYAAICEAEFAGIAMSAPPPALSVPSTPRTIMATPRKPAGARRFDSPSTPSPAEPAMVTPGLPSLSMRSAKEKASGVDISPIPPKKARVSQSHSLPSVISGPSEIILAHIGSGNADVEVRQPLPILTNPLMATDWHIATDDPLKSFPCPKTKPRVGRFWGVLDNLKDLSSCRPVSCTHPPCRLPNRINFVALLLVALLGFASLSAVCAMPAQASPLSPTTSLSIMALNANGLVKAEKIDLVARSVFARRPHVFVGGETKTNSRTKLSRSILGEHYNFYDEPGQPDSRRDHFKWGVVVGVRKDIQVSQRLEVKDLALAGRIIALDLVLPTRDGRCYSHRFIGTYVPWNPGMDDLSRAFWPSLTSLCQTSEVPWTIAGDLNATVASFERKTGGSLSRQLYLTFLSQTGGHDLWSDYPDRSRSQDWTCKARTDTEELIANEGNIIDRVASSAPGLFNSTIEVGKEFVPGSDHRSIHATVHHLVPLPVTFANPNTSFTRQQARSPRVR